MRLLRLIRRHAMPFWRYWNRDLGDWRGSLLFWLAVLCVLCCFGSLTAYIGTSLFALCVIAWTAYSADEYRAALRRDGHPPVPGRHRVHDRNDIWKGW